MRKAFETKNGTAVFEKTGNKLIDGFFKKFSGNFAHQKWFGATELGTPDLNKTIKATIPTSDLVFEVKAGSFKINLMSLNRKENSPILGSFDDGSKPGTVDGYLHIIKIGSKYSVGVFAYHDDGVVFLNYIKDLQIAK